MNTALAVGGLTLPNFETLGLGNITAIQGIRRTASPKASVGRMAEVSRGKDSTTGHWELSGIILEKGFPTYPQRFPDDLLSRFLAETGCKGYLGTITASGTVIIQQLGDEHVRTGFPIVYTSADSVFQIAAHEEIIPLSRLYDICQKTRDRVCVGDAAVGRVIARPFVGATGNYTRTTNRRDFSLEPPSATVLDVLMDNNIPTIGIGKIDDLFAGRGLKEKIHTESNAQGIDETLKASRATEGGFVFTNLVDFDTLYGHRNDPKGFAEALEEFDRFIPSLIDTLGEGDLLILTADHGNDPVTPSTDHSREYVPVMAYTKSKETGTDIGTRNTFADLGKTVADFFGVRNTLDGTSFLRQVM